MKREAEIIWILFCVRHGFSDSSMTHFVSMLSMFPGVDNAKILALGKESIECYVNYGIYPYFKELLKVEVNNSLFIVSCFDDKKVSFLANIGCCPHFLDKALPVN